MALYAVNGGDLGLAADLNQYYELLTGVTNDQIVKIRRTLSTDAAIELYAGSETFPRFRITPEGVMHIGDGTANPTNVLTSTVLRGSLTASGVPQTIAHGLGRLPRSIIGWRGANQASADTGNSPILDANASPTGGVYFRNTNGVSNVAKSCDDTNIYVDNDTGAVIFYHIIVM